MNTNQLKRFAKEARIKLLDQVSRKLEFVIANTDQVFIDTYNSQINSLNLKIKQIGQNQVIEMVAYTWFNRLMALRFMDANGYTVPKVVTPLPGMTNPEILQNALGGNIEPELHLDHQRLNNLLDGRTATADAHTEAYKMLLIAACNQWHKAMPFMFERISDFTELLLPDDLLSDYSIVADIRNGMSAEDCQQEEIIGWLYQFYISDKKDDVFEGLKKNIKITAENIPAATQLFTPRWIVRYMVENTLGKLWLTFKPNSRLRNFMPYYIEAPEGNMPSPLPSGIKSITDITFLDPCQGSGHVLVYAFDLFTHIYEEEGYNTSEIPALILQHNLFGIDIDERAAQLAAFALTMKARSYYSRFLRKPEQPNVIALENVSEETIQQAVKLPVTIKGKKITDYKDLTLNLLTQADNFGSLIQIETEEVAAIQIQQGSIWQEQLRTLKEQAVYLSHQYHCVVTNPPYMGFKGMNDSIRSFLSNNFPSGKYDLMVAFIEQLMNVTTDNGFFAFLNYQSWLFISSFEDFRKTLLKNSHINSILHIGRGLFGSDFGTVSFSFQKTLPAGEISICYRLFDYYVNVQSNERLNEIFLNKESKCFLFKQDNFLLIPGNTFAYWASEELLSSFAKNRKLEDYATPKQGATTSDNNRFLRYWFEVFLNDIGFGFSNLESAKKSNIKWFPYNKGGEYQKYYGNQFFIINYKNDGEEIKSFHKILNQTSSGGRLKNQESYFKPSISWSKVSYDFAARYYPQGFIFDVAGSSIFPENQNRFLNLLGFLNSNIVPKFLEVLSPTVNFESEHLRKIPISEKIFENENILNLTNIIIEKTKEYSSLTNEISFDFKKPWLITKRGYLNKIVEEWKSMVSEDYVLIGKSQYQLNKEVISVYNLSSDFSAEFSLRDITILQEYLDLEGVGRKLFSENISTSYIKPLIFTEPLIKDLLMYSIGILLGRYSLAHDGVICNRDINPIDKTLYSTHLSPDEDNIIPVMDDEWFTDDIVGGFKVFLKAAFGGEYFEDNLRFIEDAIGKDIRKYFVNDFYNDHIKRYKKRPIYWMFSSPKGHFKALIYMHRYQPDLCSKLLNDYLLAFIGKLDSAKNDQTRLSLREDISAREKTIAIKEVDKYEAMLKDCRNYERTLFDIATQKIAIDLDDGVKVNYQKFKEVLVPIKGLEADE